MSAPRPGWTVQRALDRLAQGYSLDRVARLSGYDEPFLLAQLADQYRKQAPAAVVDQARVTVEQTELHRRWELKQQERQHAKWERAQRRQAIVADVVSKMRR